MRHRNFGKKLGRNHNQRQALFKTLARQLFTYGALETTAAKSAAVRPYVDKLAHKILRQDLISYRDVDAAFQDRQLVNQLMTQFSAAFAGHQGAFLKEEKIKRRQGDDALIVKLSFVKPFKLQLVESKKTPEPKKTVEKKPKTVKEKETAK
ncbi:hypothetical protein M1116_03295 [Patescibacteria group bacterium]|nr:hypothetical protein [Patescibacteria group bacterium]